MIIANAGIGYGFPAAFTPNVGTQDVFFNMELTDDQIPYITILCKKYS